jgi:hypothetical protein
MTENKRTREYFWLEQERAERKMLTQTMSVVEDLQPLIGFKQFVVWLFLFGCRNLIPVKILQ